MNAKQNMLLVPRKLFYKVTLQPTHSMA